jgi:hypothetical protein
LACCLISTSMCQLQHVTDLSRVVSLLTAVAVQVACGYLLSRGRAAMNQQQRQQLHCPWLTGQAVPVPCWQLAVRHLKTQHNLQLGLLVQACWGLRYCNAHQQMVHRPQAGYTASLMSWIMHPLNTIRSEENSCHRVCHTECGAAATALLYGMCYLIGNSVCRHAGTCTHVPSSSTIRSCCMMGFERPVLFRGVEISNIAALDTTKTASCLPVTVCARKSASTNTRRSP